ncbi:MAG: 3 beta-hydroxysteroid dehydrogenase/Delta 5--_4-isomerase [bacterium ADurb.Bin429]|nr:MAG: 3 beta-hydroxysteroid dehydrogenase/Delta 5-->4-isomerase [bacterium ADurb.Bin429]
MRIFLTGGTGFVGTRIRDALLTDGHEVTTLTRRERPHVAGITWIPGTLDDTDSLEEGMRGCAAVVHLVGIIRERRGATFQSVHVDGTRNVLAAMKAAGISRLLHMSALGAGPKAETAYFKTKWAAEESVRASGVAFTIFRPSIVFGPGDGFITLLARQVRVLPILPIIGTGAYLMAPVSIHVVTAAFTAALRMNGAAVHKTFDLCGPQILTYEEIVNLLIEHLKRPRRKVHLPVWLMRLVTGTAKVAHLPLPITRDQLAMLLKGNVCEEHHAQEVFDLPVISLREGIGEYLHPQA